MSVSSYGGNSSRISRYSLTEEDDEGEYDISHHEEQNDRVSTTSIKMKRCDLIAQLERLGYEDVPEDVVQEFIAELKTENIEVEDEDTENTTQLSSSVLPEDDEDEDDEQAEEDQDEEEEESVPVTESEHDYEEDELNTYLPEYTPILNNNNTVDDEDEDGRVQIIKRTAVNESFNHINEEDYNHSDDEGYDTATYYGKHYSSSMKEVDMARDTSFNSSFSTKPQAPPQTINNIPSPNVYNSPARTSTNNMFTSPTRNHLSTPKKVETVSYPFSSPNRKSQDHDDYHRPITSRDVTHHDLQTPTSKVKFKPLEESNYTPPSLPVSRPKSAPPVKTPIKEPVIKTPSKSESPKDSSQTGKNSSMVRSSTSSSISCQSAKPLPFKSNVKKPVTYRKKVNDPVNRWREMNAMWKNDPFLKNQQSQQKNHRWRVRQEMLEIQGDKYLNPKESR